jgi:hypothetical protein
MERSADDLVGPLGLQAREIIAQFRRGVAGEGDEEVWPGKNPS